MDEPAIAILGFSLLVTACAGSTTAPSAVAVSASTSSAASVAFAPQPSVHTIGPEIPPGLVPTQEVIDGSVGPVGPDWPPCYLERYACEKHDFTMERDGAVEVTLRWEGNSRAMLIQLYRAGAGLVHEDLAPRDGPPEITFRRTDITAMDYELRVVNMETNATHAFELTLTTWE